jgi:hypothetical protein
MEDIEIIEFTPENIVHYGVCGYKDVDKHIELKRKIDWYAEYYPKGLRIKGIITKTGVYQGMLEYIPGKYAHRPVNADGYMFIQCIFAGFKKEFKEKGYASLLLDTCIEDAKNQEMLGVAVVTRKGSFMADNRIFLKKGFQICDKAKPDFELLVLKFSDNANNPSFSKDINKIPEEYQKGLTIMRSVQCPYTEKNIKSIIETAKKMNINTRLVELTNAEEVQQSPCAFGSFCIIYNGKIISHHPISNTRFENIMKQEYKQ